MSLLGLELSDVGIMVVSNDPLELLQVDGADRESPGFALPEGNRLLVGRTAEDKAHLHPRRFNNIFWSQLNTEPLKQPNPYAQNHAEMAYTHLAKIWENIKGHGDELVIAVPGFLDRDQLGLFLGIAEELSIPLKGIVALPVAASSTPCPGRMLLHLDIHLHWSEVNLLEQGKSLNLEDSVTAEGKGLHNLHKEWVEAIAAEFVRTTRFDPLHRADFEQALYNRLPSILVALQHEPLVMCEMTAGPKTHRVSLSRDLFIQKSEATFSELLRLIKGIRDRYDGASQPVTLQLTHRINRLPGCKEMVAKMTDTQTIELEPGSAAFGVLNLNEELIEQRGKKGVSYLMSRPWTKQHTMSPHPSSQSAGHTSMQPTHILYRNMAYPISDQPLTIGWGGPGNGVGVTMADEMAGVSERHCSIQIRGKEVVLTDHSTNGTFVDETPVTNTVVLKLGQIIRVGTGEKLQLIACLEKHET
jgi:hypothetical protein